MNAEEAKKAAREAAEKQANALLEDIRNEIARAAKAGKLSLVYPKQLPIAVKKALRIEGFTVRSSQVRGEDSRLEPGAFISWIKATDKLDSNFVNREGK